MTERLKRYHFDLWSNKDEDTDKTGGNCFNSDLHKFIDLRDYF